MRRRVTLTALSLILIAAPAAHAQTEKCITQEEAMKLGLVIGAETVREGLEMCTRNFPEIRDETFVPGAEKNLEKAAATIEEAEKAAREGFERAFGAEGGHRFERFRQDAMQSTRQGLASFGEIECRASVVGYAKIAELLAQKPDEARFISAEDLRGDLPICPN